MPRDEWRNARPLFTTLFTHSWPCLAHSTVRFVLVILDETDSGKKKRKGLHFNVNLPKFPSFSRKRGKSSKSEPEDEEEDKMKDKEKEEKEPEKEEELSDEEKKKRGKQLENIYVFYPATPKCCKIHCQKLCIFSFLGAFVICVWLPKF